MAVPYTFGTATSSIPLSQLDSNFATAITLGSTNVYLGNTTTTLVGFANLSSTLITSPTHNSGTTLSLQTGGTTGLYIDASQNVGIGTSSPVNKLVTASNVANSKIEIQNTSTAASTSKTSALQFSGTDTAGTLKESGDIYIIPADNNYVGSNMLFYTRGSDTIAERMRIDTSGNVAIGNTAAYGSAKFTVSQSAASNPGIAVNQTAASPTVNTFWSSYNAAASTSFVHFYATTSANTIANFQILGNGNTQNSNNSYGAISDIKLKENIVDASPKLADLMQVKIRNYTFKSDNGENKQIGVIAQELETIFPSMIDEVYDRDTNGNALGTKTKSVKYSVFVPMLIKAIQELKAEFDAYKASHP